MVVYIRVLKWSPEVRELLFENRWDVEELGNGILAASHPLVVDQTEARIRLWRLGLLTSSRVRIDFEPHFAPCATRGISIHGTHAHRPHFLHSHGVG